MMDQRARLTVPDLAFIVASVFVLGALWPVFADGLAARASSMSTGAVYLWRLVLPMAVLVLLAVIFAKAVRGVGQ